MVKNLSLILIFSIFSLLFTSCSDNKNIEQTNISYPIWYLNPIQNSSTTLYGAGEGKNLDEASKNALENLSSKLMVTINSTTTIFSKSHRDFREYTSKITTYDIKSQIEQLSFRNYLVENRSFINSRVVVQVSVLKADLAKNLKDELNILYSEYEFINRQNFDSLNLFLKKEELLFDFYKNINKAQILDSLGYDIGFIKKIDSLKTEVESLKNSISFFVSFDNKSEKFQDIYKDSLTKKGFKITNSKNNTYEISLSSNSSQKSPQGFYIVENILNIKLFDSKKNQIKTKIIELKGASSIDFNSANLNLVQKLKKEEESNNILPF